MIKKLKSEILTSIKNKKINVFLLFLLSAFIILIFSKLSKQYTKTIVFNIEKINVPKANVILSDTTSVLSLTLKTHGFKWLEYYIREPKIVVDFSKDVYKKDSFFVWSKSEAFLSNTQFDKQVELLNISPDTLMFAFGKNEVKTVPVKLNSNIKFASGYDISNGYILEPDSVQIIGPDLLVKELEYLETDTISLSNIKSDISKFIKLKLPESQKDLQFSHKNINLIGKVEKHTEGTLKIPVNVINVPKGTNLNFFPKVVSLTYYVSLSNFKSVKSNDFKVVCDYRKVTANQSVLIPELIKSPKTVKNVKINQQRIEFIITE